MIQMPMGRSFRRRIAGPDGRESGQIIYRLQLRAGLAVPVTDLALTFQKQETIQRQDGPDHIFPDPLGLELGPDPDPAVDVESRVPPRKDPLGPFVAEEPLADQKRQDLPAEDLGQARNRSTTGYAHFTLESPCPFAA